MTISGAGSFSKVYGQRASPKLWAFGWSENNHKIGGCDLDPTPECHWTWYVKFRQCILYFGYVELDVRGYA